MRLSDNNFFRNELTIILDGRKFAVVRYGYEANTGLYNIDALSSSFTTCGKTYTRLYAKNSRYIAHPEKIHKAIEQHFNL